MRHVTIEHIHWAGLGVVASAGVLVAHCNWDHDNEWFYVGLGMVLITAPMFISIQIHHQAHRIDMEFRAGQRIGYRSGRADALKEVAMTNRRYHRAVSRQASRGEGCGRIQETSLRLVAGDDPRPRWPA